MNLTNRLARQICSNVESCQNSILARISAILPKDKRDFIEITPRRMPFDISYVFTCHRKLDQFRYVERSGSLFYLQ